MSLSADAVLAQAGTLAGIDVEPAQLIRDGSNTLFKLPHKVVARIGPPGSSRRARRETEVSEWLRASGIPVVEPVSGVDQPTLVEGRPVTWWQELPPHRPATPAELGAALHRLHQLPIPDTPTLPGLDPLNGFAARIEQATWLPPHDRTWLANHLDHLRHQWEHLPAGQPACVIHGDAWQGNVAVPDPGTPVLLDLEHVAIGPPEWDLIAIAVDHTDFERIDHASYQTFVDAYHGHDVTDWPGYRVLADIVELRWACFALGRAAHRKGADEEALHRIACLRGEIPRPWQWTAL